MKDHNCKSVAESKTRCKISKPRMCDEITVKICGIIIVRVGWEWRKMIKCEPLKHWVKQMLGLPVQGTVKAKKA